jgi:hypothetical protein
MIPANGSPSLFTFLCLPMALLPTSSTPSKDRNRTNSSASSPQDAAGHHSTVRAPRHAITESSPDFLLHHSPRRRSRFTLLAVSQRFNYCLHTACRQLTLAPLRPTTPGSLKTPTAFFPQLASHAPGHIQSLTKT